MLLVKPLRGFYVSDLRPVQTSLTRSQESFIKITVATTTRAMFDLFCAQFFSRFGQKFSIFASLPSARLRPSALSGPSVALVTKLLHQVKRCNFVRTSKKGRITEFRFNPLRRYCYRRLKALSGVWILSVSLCVRAEIFQLISAFYFVLIGRYTQATSS